MNRTLLHTAIAVAGVITAFAAGAQIVLYENDNFNGRNYRASTDVSNLNDSGFNDKASSVSVGRRWQLCDDASSAAAASRWAPANTLAARHGHERQGVVGPRARMDAGRRRRLERQQFYNSDSGYSNGNKGRTGVQGVARRAVSGLQPLRRSVRVSAPAASTTSTASGFNDKARSLRVESGYWLFCTDADFQGDCHTYGPGDYPNLPAGKAHSISSGPRVSGNYPYRNNPNWGGGNGGYNNNRGYTQQ